MKILLSTILLVQGFVLLKAKNDSIYIREDKVVPTHVLEWLMIAWVATIGSIGYSHKSLIIIALDLLQMAITWILQDLELNTFLKVKNPFTYVGSGKWDKLFKKWFPYTPAKAMWVAKGLLLFLTSWLFYETIHLIPKYEIYAR